MPATFRKLSDGKFLKNGTALTTGECCSCGCEPSCVWISFHAEFYFWETEEWIGGDFEGTAYLTGPPLPYSGDPADTECVWRGELYPQDAYVVDIYRSFAGDCYIQLLDPDGNHICNSVSRAGIIGSYTMSGCSDETFMLDTVSVSDQDPDICALSAANVCVYYRRQDSALTFVRKCIPASAVPPYWADSWIEDSGSEYPYVCSMPELSNCLEAPCTVWDTAWAALMFCQKMYLEGALYNSGHTGIGETLWQASLPDDTVFRIVGFAILELKWDGIWYWHVDGAGTYVAGSSSGPEGTYTYGSYELVVYADSSDCDPP